MSNAELKKIVTELYDKKLNLNEILDVLVKEKDIDITFMDLRLLVSEIEDERNLYDQEEEVEEVEEELEEEIEEEQECVIEMNSIVQPGAPMQGKARFKSGCAMKFMLDPYGRIGIEPIGEQQPTQEELNIFQQQLVSQLKSGMI